MDMPSIFYAVRPMNTDRSDAGQRRMRWRRPLGPDEIIGASSSYTDISITRAYANLATRSNAKKKRPRVAVRRTAPRGTSHYDSSGVRPTSSARIRRDTYPLTIHVINRRFVSTFPPSVLYTKRHGLKPATSFEDRKEKQSGRASN